MTSQQKIILIGGAGAAFLIFQSKRAGASVIDPKTGKLVPANRPGLLSTLLPTRGTNTPYIASTNAATRNGTATTARVPSSGLGFPTTAARGVAGAPTTIGGVAEGAGNALRGLFEFLGRTKPTTTAPRSTTPQSGKQPSAAAGSGGGNSGGGGSSNSGGRTAPMGGSAGVAGQVYSNGYFDDNGAWHGYDGYYDNDGQFVQLNADGTLPGNDQGGNGLEAIVPNVTPQNADLIAAAMADSGGAIDENGDWDPASDPGVETTFDDDVLPSTDLGTGSIYDSNAYADQGPQDFEGPIQPDPITFDQPDTTGYADDQLAGDGIADGIDVGANDAGDYLYSDDF